MNELNYTCNLSAGLRMTPLKAALVQGEANAHKMKIAFEKDGAPYSMDAGATIVGSFIRLDSVASTDDNPTILLQGAVNDGVASVTLSAACYAVVGRFRLMVTATVGEDTTAILWLEGRVATGATGSGRLQKRSGKRECSGRKRNIRSAAVSGEVHHGRGKIVTAGTAANGGVSLKHCCTKL